MVIYRSVRLQPRQTEDCRVLCEKEMDEFERLSAFLRERLPAAAELRSIVLKERLKIACIALTVVSLFVLALVVPHADHSLAEALGR